MPRRLALSALLSLTLLLSCDGDVQDPTHTISAMQCMPERSPCGGGGGGEGSFPRTDPRPDAPGLWLGMNMGLARCYSPTGRGINDVDSDGLDEWCEQWIANSFRPALRTNPEDCDLRSEPAWGVKYFFASGIIRVGYFLSYYNDCGNHHVPGCRISQPASHRCTGHDGDSEFIVLDLTYDAVTDHYLVQRAFTSAHYGEDHDYSMNVDDTRLEFPEKPQGYPRIWVALGKHANYPTGDLCNSGARFNADSCEGNSVETRMEFIWGRNIGSPIYQMLDCTPAKPEMQVFRPGIECYWDGYDPWQPLPPERFFGWWWQEGANPFVGGSTPYGRIIWDVFEPATMPPGRP